MIQSVTIGGTINLGNYESLRLDVCADSAEEARTYLRECLKMCALDGSTEQDLIKTWVNRVIGSDME